MANRFWSLHQIHSPKGDVAGLLSKKPWYAKHHELALMEQQDTKHVPPEVVNSKWVNLSVPAQEQVRGLFRAVERPLFMRYRDEDKRAEAQFAVTALLQEVERKLPGFPFPPDTRDAHFDYEKLLESNRALEAQLTPSIHSIGLLREAIQQEEASLEADMRKLGKLEKEAKAEENLRSRRTKNVHPLLNVADDAESVDDDAENIGLIEENANEDANSFDAVDSDLTQVIEQLQGYVDSMQVDLVQAHELGDAVSTTRAAINELYYRQLSSREYTRFNESLDSSGL
ncbi:MAG: hypothetical protein M1816_001936 [Peltula sp. TS41687]|nr:MAG: hypothetical protein M1816_001936 [Peltula sp. TS41687]